MLRSILMCSALTTLMTGLLVAQEPTAVIASGRLVRIKVATGPMYEGTLLAPTSDTLRLVRPGLDTVRIRREAIERFEVYAGEGHNVGRAAVNGSLIGGGIGLVLGAVSAAGQEEGGWYYTPPGLVVASGILGGALFGAGIGAIVGLISRSPKWEKAPLPTMTVTGGLGDRSVVRLGIHLRF